MTMTIEEAKAMRGTEFTYVFPDGDTIQAYVKEFVPEKGLSCHSLALVTRDGYDISYAVVKSEDSVCLVGYDFEDPRDSEKLPKVLRTLEEIKRTGKFCAGMNPPGSLDPVCAFR